MPVEAGVALGRPFACVGEFGAVLERVAAHYLLTRVPRQPGSFTIETAEDGLPVIRANGGTLTSELVREIEVRPCVLPPRHQPAHGAGPLKDLPQLR